MATYDRYSLFRNDGQCKIVPYIEIPVKNTDAYEIYHKNQTRLDVLSNQYYGDPNYGWLILQANPSVGSMEYAIPDETVLRIPYPLDVTLNDYKNGIDEYNKLY